MDKLHQERLKKAFDAVCDPYDWRAPIGKYLPLTTVDAVGGFELIREAIIHFTATVPEIQPWNEGFFFKAKGYREGPAGP